MLWLRTRDTDAMGLSGRATDVFNTHKQSLSVQFISPL